MITAPIGTLSLLLQKAATDNGFDRELPPDGHWLAFSSTQCPMRLWLGVLIDGRYVAALSQQNVLRALADLAAPFTLPLPPSAVGALAVIEIPALHPLLRRAFQLSKTLPDQLLQAFKAQTTALPATTEAERLVVQRVGQDIFRKGLLEFWEGRCAITGLAEPELLRASHIKPWADCSNDAERLDVYNGFLLAPHLDAAFDRGFISVADDGMVIVSRELSKEASQLLRLDRPLKLRAINDGHRGYLPWHRDHVYRRSSSHQVDADPPVLAH